MPGDRVELLLAPPSMVPGWQEAYYPADPGPALNVTRVVPGETWERLIAVTFTFVASAAVQNRFCHIYWQDGNGKRVAGVQASGAVVAGTSVNPFLVLGSPGQSGAVSGQSFGFIPDLLMPSGWQIQVQASPVDAADQISGVIMLLHRFRTDQVQDISI